MRYLVMTLMLAAAVVIVAMSLEARAEQGERVATTRPAMVADPSKMTESQWKAMLTPEEYSVLREKGTERAFTGTLTDETRPGTYYCAACGQELFRADTKFHSGCGWPAFYAAAAGDRVKLTKDFSYGMVRTEVTCSRCGSHLGHVFDDAPDQPTGQRFCINSVSLKFVPDAKPATQPTK